MRLQYASDLHLEMLANRDFVLAGALEPAAEYLLLAGDISLLSDWHKADAFWDWCARSFQHTWIVPGNHDYHADRSNLLGLASLQVPVRPNVTYANNVCVHVEEVSLVLTTLWSAITLQKTEIEEEVVDYRQIYFDGKTISTEIVNRLHSESRAFLARTLQMCNPNKTVVVTHYVPGPQATPERYVNSPVREAFIADCCDLIDAYQPAFWIHGHSHVSGNVQYGRTRIVSNQLGTVRPGKELNFNPKAVIEV